MKFLGIKIIDKYIIRKFLGTYIFAMGLIIIVVVIFDAAEKVDDFMELKAPLSKIIFNYYLNFIPFFLNQFSGLFTFIAVIFFTSKMAYNTEIIAILSSGVSFKRLLYPYFVSATAIALLSLTLNLFVIPRANARRLDFETHYIKRMLNQRYDRFIYRQVEPGTFVFLRDFAGENGGAAYFALETYKDNSIVSSLEAANAKFNSETGRWTAPKSIERKFDGTTEIFNNTQPLDTVINLQIMELGRVEETVKTMNLFELNQFIHDQKEKGSDMIAQFEVERQNRFAYPVATFILTVIGVSLSSRKMRGGTGIHIGTGIVLCFSFILFSRFAEEFAKGGVLPAGISVWIPNIIYAFIAVYLYKKAPK